MIQYLRKKRSDIMKKNIIAIVGRPNVGKSTLFNKIAGGKIAIVEDKPGVTRDRLLRDVNYQGKIFTLIDTGGIDDEALTLNEEIKVQAEIAIKEANVIIFVVDGKEGLTQNDYIIRNLLHKSGKKVIVAINKVDNKQAKDHLYDFYE